ncbi:PREDICTED: uncharacterized protein LOC108545386 [Eufriesea mexicana]|uniref:uncharacterized protein LOC108545386 n=1 Tax=Eufriesea mexicana TaxID=516756 RepID=UPI00083C8900|nr:PREDICTED: uncharacterized protein LOC108545386 [Eufriesea mexicana]
MSTMTCFLIKNGRMNNCWELYQELPTFSRWIYNRDYQLFKLLSDAGIGVAISQFKSTLNISQFLHTRYCNLGIFLNLQCSIADKDVVKIFYETSTHQMFDHLHQWLILGKSMNHIVKLLNDSAFSIITDVAIAVPRNDDYILYDVYNHCKACGGLLKIIKLGSWSRDNGLHIILQIDKFTRRWNYHRMRIKLSGIVTVKPVNQSLVEYLHERNDIYTDHWAKFGFAIMERIKDIFNFTYEITYLSHWEENDTSGPLHNAFKNNIADLGYFPLSITMNRLDNGNVLVQFSPTRTCFMLLTMPASKMDMNVLFRPFEKNVWYMIILLTVIILLVLWVAFKLEKHVANTDYDTTGLIIVGAFCQQGLPFENNQFSSRVVFLQTMIFGLLVYNYYSAAIVSSRLYAPLERMNDSLFSLVKSKMKVASHKSIYFNALLGTPTKEVKFFKKYWETIPEEERFYSIPEGVKKITEFGFAYHAEPYLVYPVIERVFDNKMICQLSEVHLLRPTALALWSSPKSKFHEITKIGLIRIYTSGIRQRELKRWTTRQPYCDKDKYYVSSVTIYETTPIILILLVGIILSVIICFVENIIFRTIRKKQGQIIETNNTNKK